MNDTPRPVATNDDSEFSLTIQEVAARYEQAGYPRTIRTLQRYCKSGHLDALKKPTLLGDMYLVTPHSVDRHIAQIGQMESATLVATGRDEPRSAATSVADQHKAIGEHEEDATSDDTSRPVATNAPDESRYVVRLESENEFLRGQVAVKDTQIKDLTERARETNHLIAGLQKMLSPLLGSGERRSEVHTYDPVQTSPHDHDYHDGEGDNSTMRAA